MICLVMFIGCSAQHVEHVQIGKLTDEQKKLIDDEYQIYYDSTCEELSQYEEATNEYIKSIFELSENRSNVAETFGKGLTYPQATPEGLATSFLFGISHALLFADLGNLSDVDQSSIISSECKLIALKQIMEDHNCTKKTRDKNK